MSFSHLDQKGKACMVDVSTKPLTAREAVARARVILGEKTFNAVADQRLPKGDLFAVARIAGIMAAKKVGDLIPLCHPLSLSVVNVDLVLEKKDFSINIEASVKTVGPTGVEMEALTAVSVAALTVYDMCKALDKGIRITDIRLVRKSGGKSGTIILED